MQYFVAVSDFTTVIVTLTRIIVVDIIIYS